MPTIFYNQKEQRVGWLDDKGTYRKSVKKSEHFFKKENGWAISTSIINELIKKLADKVEIQDLENKVKYVAKVKDFIEHGMPIHYDDAQLCLDINKFTIAK